MSARSYFDCRVTTSCKHETFSGLFFLDMFGNLAVPAIWRAKEHVNDLRGLQVSTLGKSQFGFPLGAVAIKCCCNQWPHNCRLNFFILSKTFFLYGRKSKRAFGTCQQTVSAPASAPFSTAPAIHQASRSHTPCIHI